MEFAEVVRRRRMVRRYLPDPVEPEAVRRIVATALRGPSAGFSQPHRFVVVTAEAGRRRIADAADEKLHVARGLLPWVSAAPVHIVCCIDQMAYTRRYAERDKGASADPRTRSIPFDWVDAGTALMLLLLAAVDEHLAAGFLAIEPERLRAAASVPPEWTPWGLVTLGHADPAEGRPGSQRRPRVAFERAVVSDVD